MPDASAPAGATATAPTQGSTNATNGKAPNGTAGKPAPSTPAPKTPAPRATKPAEAPQTSEAEDAWDEAKDRGELERLIKKWSKHDPKARVRVRGEEKGFESLDDVYSMISDAQRGRGASKVVEEAKREAAEARKVLELRERAANGDLHALRELAGDNALQGLEQLRQRTTEEQQLREQMSDAERLLFDRNQQLEQLLAQREEMDRRAAAEKEETTKKQLIESAKSEAKTRAKAILEGLKLPPEKLGTVGPFVVRAMREAAELGLELGKDVPPEKLIESAKSEMRGVLSESIEGLAPEQLADFLDELKPNTLRALAKVFYQRARGQQAPPPAQQQTSRETKRQGPAIGTPGYLRSLVIP